MASPIDHFWKPWPAKGLVQTGFDICYPHDALPKWAGQIGTWGV